VIHISSGFAGLASTLVIGKRKIVSENQNETPPPHNVMLVYLGGAILWVSWFGFNAGSAVAANQSASMAMLVCVCPGIVGVCVPMTLSACSLSLSLSLSRSLARSLARALSLARSRSLSLAIARSLSLALSL